MLSLKFVSSRSAKIALVLAGALALGIAGAEARGGKSGSVGSRGSKTYAAPPATNTAPSTAQPMQRSTTQPGAATAAQAGRPGMAPQASPSRFGSGFGGMLMGGLLGAGLFGLLSGSGLFGGMSGMAGMLGLLLQVALIGGVIWLAMSFFRGRQAASAGGMGSNQMNRQGMGQQFRPASTPAGGFAAPAAAAAVATSPLNIVGEDFEAFEKLLGRVQNAYGKESIAELRALMTPEMAGYMSEDIAENQRQNVHNLVSDAKLLQGDLSEAWSEPDAEYATVAMRFSVLDTTVERGTGRVVSGNPDRPEEATEVWTFVRRRGAGAGGWKVSAIQQTQ